MRRAIATVGTAAVVVLEPSSRAERMRGLAAIGPLPAGHALLLPRARVVRSAGARCAVAFLDADLRIVAVRSLRPLRLAGPVRGARHVLEAPERTALRAGEALQLVGAPSEAEPTSRAYFAR
ncbi:MAG: hypothetical protein ACKO8G_02075, partial [Actinomycetota bacterium]